MTDLDFDIQCKVFGIPKPETEFQFYPDRKWRTDLAWPKYKLAVEIEGGAWTQGRHTRGSGFIKDMAKYNALEMLGFHLLRFTPTELKNGYAGRMIKEFIEARERSIERPKVARPERIVG